MFSTDIYKKWRPREVTNTNRCEEGIGAFLPIIPHLAAVRNILILSVNTDHVISRQNDKRWTVKVKKNPGHVSFGKWQKWAVLLRTPTPRLHSCNIYSIHTNYHWKRCARKWYHFAHAHLPLGRRLVDDAGDVKISVLIIHGEFIIVGLRKWYDCDVSRTDYLTSTSAIFEQFNWS